MTLPSGLFWRTVFLTSTYATSWPSTLSSSSPYLETWPRILTLRLPNSTTYSLVSVNITRAGLTNKTHQSIVFFLFLTKILCMCSLALLLALACVLFATKVGLVIWRHLKHPIYTDMDTDIPIHIQEQSMWTVNVFL